MYLVSSTLELYGQTCRMAAGVRGGLLLRRIPHLVLLCRRLMVLGSASSYRPMCCLTLCMRRTPEALLLILGLLLILALVLSLHNHRGMGLRLLRK